MIDKIINASAGTGKTYTILNEVLDFEGGKPIENVKQDLKTKIFLSFSNAAVEELKQRIFEHIEKNEKSEESISLAERLDGFSDYRVFTIHSFAMELAKMCRYELGLPSDVDFVPLENFSVWSHVVNEFFRKEWDRGILREKICGDSDEIKIMLDICMILSQDRFIKKFIMEKGDNIYFVNEIAGKYKDPDKKELDRFMGLLGFESGVPYEKISSELEEVLFRKNKELAEVPARLTWIAKEIRRLEKGIEDLKEKGQQKRREKIEALQAESQSLINSSGILESYRILNKCAPVIERLIKYVGDNYYMPLLFEDAVFDFDAIVFLVIKFLKQKGKKWLVEKMDREGFEFDTIFIDEAQDNDIVQNYLINILAGDDGENDIKVTIVGDMKQSIYQWRNAYPEEFRAIYEEAKTMNKAHDLKKTWRIENRKTLDFLNKIFGAVSGAAGDMWDYAAEKDELERNARVEKEAEDKSPAKLLSYRKLGNTVLDDEKKTINDFLKNGKSGILTRSRPAVKAAGITELIEKDIKYRVKIEKGNEDLDKVDLRDTMHAEYMVLRTLLYTQASDYLGAVPFYLYFTQAGRLIKQGIPDDKFRDTFPGKIMDSGRYAGNLYRVYSQRRISSAIYTLMNRYDLWKYMLHGDKNGISDRLDHKVIRRNINSILAEIYLYENNVSSSMFDAEDMIASMPEAQYTPFEWYGKPGEDNSDSVEVTTIHSSKGMEYDNSIVIGNFNSLLSPEPEMKGDFENFYHVEFKKILGKDPEIDITFFPYAGLTPANLIRDIFGEGIELWDGCSRAYNGVKKKQMSEKLNLVYVALTRTKKNLMIIDMHNAAKLKNNKDTAGLQGVLGGILPKGYTCRYDLKVNDAVDSPAEEIIYYEMKGKKELLKGEQEKGSLSVRDYIAGEMEIQFRSGKKLTLNEKYHNIETGVAVHEMLERIMEQLDEFEGYESKLKQTGDNAVKDEQAADVNRSAVDILSSDNSKKELESRIGKLLPGNFRPEVPVWGIKDGVLIKGVIDAIAEKDGKISIIEYKTVFGEDETAQKEFGEKQLTVYEDMLSHIYKNKPIEKISVILKK